MYKSIKLFECPAFELSKLYKRVWKNDGGNIMKYAVTLVTRDINNYSDVQSTYLEFDNIKSLNDFLFSNICNSNISREIITFYFEIFSNIQNPCPVGDKTDILKEV